MHAEGRRTKRQTITEITPVSATVELFMIVDFGLWSKMSSQNLVATGATDHTVNILLYFGHMAEVVSLGSTRVVSALFSISD